MAESVYTSSAKSPGRALEPARLEEVAGGMRLCRDSPAARGLLLGSCGRGWATGDGW